MDNIWAKLSLEIGFIALCGVLFYFYQKRKIMRYEENKIPLVMGYLLQACLSEKKENPQPQLDNVIEALDDFLKNKTSHAPVALLKTYSDSPDCPDELKATIHEGLKEIDQ